MAGQRVFLIWTHRLFREAIRRTSAHADLVWVGETTDYQQAVQDIANYHPDAVVIEDVGDNQYHIVNILKACSTDVRIIVMNLANNKTELFNYRARSISDPEELINLIVHKNP